MFSQLHPASHESSIHSRCPCGQCMKQRHGVHRSFKMFLHLSRSVPPEAGGVCRVCAKNVEIVRKSYRGERRTPPCVAGRVPVAVAKQCLEPATQKVHEPCEPDTHRVASRCAPWSSAVFSVGRSTARMPIGNAEWRIRTAERALSSQPSFHRR